MVDMTLGQSKPKAWATLVTKPSYVAGELPHPCFPSPFIPRQIPQKVGRWHDLQFQRDVNGSNGTFVKRTAGRKKEGASVCIAVAIYTLA